MKPWCKWLVRHNMRYVLYILAVLLPPPVMIFQVIREVLPEILLEVTSTINDIKSEDGK